MVTQFKTGEEVAEFLKDPSPALLHFYAQWAPACEQVNNLLNDYIQDSKINIRTAYIEAEALPGVTMNFKVAAAPTIVFFLKGKEVNRVNGFLPSEIKEKMQLTASFKASQGIAEESVSTEKPQSLNERLSGLINSHRVMLFMKGHPQEPRCGFSRQIIELLNSKNVKYGSFDILSDDTVRQGLKEYSNWPTYPQLYFDGELVGGLDVVKEEFSDEKFVSQLPKNEQQLSLEDRLKSLINTSRLMLFMKGDRENPKCGFSRQIVALLDNAKADYKTFDILSDERVRQGLKEFSNWPTYPQLYLDGELVGGLDVVKEELLDTHFLRQIPRHGRE